MTDRSTNKDASKARPTFAERIGSNVTRKQRRRRHAAQPVWFGLGMMGLVGWSIAIPTLVGTALGIWVDERHPSEHSWTLALLVVGLVTGCVNAWHWVAKEDRAIRDEQAEEDRHE